MRDTNGMEKKPNQLPSSNLVKTWPVARVTEWLEQNEFEDFIDSFRRRQIDGAELLNLTQDRLLVEFTEQKMAKRRQLAKCVTECKVQATQAKSAVKRIRKRQRKMDDGDGSREQDDSDNEWDTDFEEEDEEEHNQYQVSNDTSSNGVTVEQDDELQDSNCDATESSPGTFRNVWSPQSATPPTSEPDIVLRKMTPISLEDQPIRTPIPKPPNTKLKVEPFSIPRKPKTHPHPRQRPPSQPPPPPSPEVHNDDDGDDEYEVPNTGIPCGFRAAKPLPVPPVPVSITLKTQHHQDMDDDTYEIMDVPEETYEAVDETETRIVKEVKLVQVDAPPLPVKSVPIALPPPPLPSKSKQIPQPENRKSSAISLVGKLAKDLDEKLKGNRQTPGGFVLKVEKKVAAVEETAVVTAENGSQEAPEPTTKNFGAVRRTPPPVHVVKPTVQPNQPGLGTGRKLTNRPLPPVPICNNSDEEKLFSLPFFHEIERHEAETLIEKMASDGSFLVRPSKRAGEHNPYTITMMHDSMIFHINIRRRQDGLFALGRQKPQEQTFCNLISLVTYHKSCPIILTLRGELSGKQYLKETPQKST